MLYQMTMADNSTCSRPVPEYMYLFKLEYFQHVLRVSAGYRALTFELRFFYDITSSSLVTWDKAENI